MNIEDLIRRHQGDEQLQLELELEESCPKKKSWYCAVMAAVSEFFSGKKKDSSSSK